MSKDTGDGMTLRDSFAVHASKKIFGFTGLAAKAAREKRLDINMQTQC